MIEIWSYDQYVAASDIVAVVEPLENQPANDQFPDMPYHAGDFEATDTLFKVHTTFKVKGNPPHSLTVLHFNYSKQATHPMDGGLFVRFPIERGMIKGIDWSSITSPGSPRAPTRESRKQGRIYLAFLKARKDGRFEPVRGQYESVLAFRELRDVWPHED